MDDFAWLESTPLSCFVCFDMVVQQVGIWPAVIIPKGSFGNPTQRGVTQKRELVTWLLQKDCVTLCHDLLAAALLSEKLH